MKLSVLLKRDLARAKRRLMAVGLAVTLGVLSVVALGSLGAGIYHGVIAPLLPRLPLDLIKVEPKVLSLGLLAFDTAKLTGGGLDEQRLASLEAVDGVAAVHPVYGASIPIRAEGGARFLGHRIRTDLFVTGVPAALVAPDIAQGYSFEDPGPEATVIPVIAARRLLDLYNSTVAAAIAKPRLSEEAVIGFSFELVLGSSYVRGTPDPSKVRRLTAQIVGLSDQATLVGVTVPARALERWNTELGSGETPVVAAYLRTRSPQDAGPVSVAVEKLGLKVDDTMKVVAAVVTAAGTVGALLALVFFGLAGLAIAQTFFLLVAERRLELAVLRAMGARRKDLRALVLAEAAVVGVLAGGLGLLLGVLGALSLDLFLARMLPEIPFKPASFVEFPPLLLLVAFLLGPVAAVLGALVPAARAAAADPAAALRQ